MGWPVGLAGRAGRSGWLVGLAGVAGWCGWPVRLPVGLSVRQAGLEVELAFGLAVGKSG